MLAFLQVPRSEAMRWRELSTEEREAPVGILAEE